MERVLLRSADRGDEIRDEGKGLDEMRRAETRPEAAASLLYYTVISYTRSVYG